MLSNEYTSNRPLTSAEIEEAYGEDVLIELMLRSETDSIVYAVCHLDRTQVLTAGGIYLGRDVRRSGQRLQIFVSDGEQPTTVLVTTARASA